MRNFLILLTALSMSTGWGQTSEPPIKASESFVGIEDALTSANRYLAENRMYAPHYMVTSAILRDRDKGQKWYWEITYEKKQSTAQTQLIRLKVNMDKSVERLDRSVETITK